MKTHLPLAVALLLPLTVMAQIYEYKDAAGRTVYTDQPPVGTAIKSKTIANGGSSAPSGTGNTASPAQKSTVDREMEFKKRQKEAKDQSAKAEKESAEKATRAEDCKRATLHLQALESGERVAMRDAQGERAFLDDEQRAAEIARTRKAIGDICR